jgi:hypothetical protein
MEEDGCPFLNVYDFTISDNNIFSNKFHDQLKKKRFDRTIKPETQNDISKKRTISKKKQTSDGKEPVSKKSKHGSDDSSSKSDDSSSKSEEPIEHEASCRWKKFVEHVPSLNDINDMVNRLIGTNSMNEKIDILEKHIHCVRALYYCSNPFWQYYISSTRVKKSMNDLAIRSQAVPVQNLFHLLDLLKSREITGNKAIGTVCNFVQANKVLIFFSDLVLLT